MEIILSIFLIIGLGLFAFITSILVQHKEEIWETIVFEEEKEDEL